MTIQPNERLSRTDYFMAVAITTAAQSKDPSSKIGAVIVNPRDETIISTGYNGFPRGLVDLPISDGSGLKKLVKADTLWEDRDLKYSLVVHAEANAIFNAHREGKSVVGCEMYGPWLACKECCKAIIQSGIRKIHGITMPGRPEWKKSIEEGFDLLGWCGVEVEMKRPSEYPMLADETIVFGGKQYRMGDMEALL